MKIRVLQWAPCVVMSMTQEHPPPILKTSMVGLLGGNDGGPGVLTTYLEDVDGGPLENDVEGLGTLTTYLEVINGGPPSEAMTEVWERSPPIMETLMAGPLGGDAEDLGVPTAYPENFDGGPTGR
jgi:hypothetical protein